MLNKKFIVLLVCLFVVMTGYGVLLPVLPFFIERLVTSAGNGNSSISFHFSILTAIYPFALVFTAPFWGKVSDRTGPKTLIILGLGGYSLMQIMIAFSTNLAMLYTARILGSLLSSFLVPVVNAYISDITTEEKRTRAIAWAGTAASAGVIIGPGISSLLIINNLHFRWQSGHWMIDRFSVPFLALAILGVITLLVSLVVLKRAKRTPATARQKLTFRIFPKGKWKSMGELLILSLIIQFAITLFESVFILYGKGVRDYSASFIGIGLLVCGLVMAILQPVIAKWGPLIFRNIKKQILYGFLIAGTVLMLFVLDQATWYLITAIGLFGLGTSLVIPNLITLISLQGNKSSGWALGMQSSFSGIGQIVGPLLGTAIYTLNRSAPFYVAGGLLVLVAFIQFNKNKILKK